MTVSLNRSKVQNGDLVDVIFTSPSRPTYTLEKSLTDQGGGFFYFNVEAAEADQLIDNSYVYRIEKDSEILKIGNVRFE